MQSKKLIGAISAVATVLTGVASTHADFSYNFNNLVGSPSPGTPLVDPVANGTALGSVGQDNWVLASGVTSYVRNDPPTGLGGNFLAGAPVDPATSTLDSIHTRVGANLGIGGSRFVTFQFDGLVGPAGFNNTAGNPVNRRSEIAPGVDANLDGDIRGMSTTDENGEVGFQFGYEATGTGWYVRGAAYSNSGTVTASTNASGVYTMQLIVDFNANPSTVVDNATGGFVNDGSGTLYVKQLADANGNAVNDVFRLADPRAANVNLGISRMGGFGGANPANWNGIDTRTAGNGGIDNILFTTGLPTTGSVWAADAGDWLNPGNWYLTLPNAVGAVAQFTTGARADSTVYADAPVTAGTIVLNNIHTYNISGAGSLTLQTASGSALVDVQVGSHKINLPLSIASNTTLNVAAGTTLRISDPVTVQSGQAITQTGSGTVLYESTINVLGGGAITFAGAQHVAALSLGSNANATFAAPSGGGFSVARFDALTLGAGAKFNLGTNEIQVPGTPAQALALIQSGQYFSSSTTGQRGLGYGAAAGGGTRVLFTLLGDADLDRTVGFSDLVSVAQNYNTASGAVFSQGDFTYDGAVNFSDLVLLAQNYNSTFSGLTLPANVSADFAADWALAQSLVPEPTTLALLFALPMAARRRRH